MQNGLLNKLTLRKQEESITNETKTKSNRLWSNMRNKVVKEESNLTQNRGIPNLLRRRSSIDSINTESDNSSLGDLDENDSDCSNIVEIRKEDFISSRIAKDLEISSKPDLRSFLDRFSMNKRDSKKNNKSEKSVNNGKEDHFLSQLARRLSSSIHCDSLDEDNSEIDDNSYETDDDSSLSFFYNYDQKTIDDDEVYTMMNFNAEEILPELFNDGNFELCDGLIQLVDDSKRHKSLTKYASRHHIF